MKKEYTVKSLEELQGVADDFVKTFMTDSTIFAFYGGMGAGKTTFINALARALGVEPEETSSPTFAIINEYRSATTAELIYHFDLYRLKDYEEALDLGADDYFESGAVCLLEWPEKISEILPDDTVSVRISADADGSRRIEVIAPDYDA